MDDEVKCARCGKAAGSRPKLLPIDGTARCAEVCGECYTYLSEDDRAYGRFVVLLRARERMQKSKKKKHRRKMI